MARRPRYSSAFKAQAVRMVLEDGRKVCEVADQLVLSPDTLKNWLRAARAGKAFPVQHLDGKDLELDMRLHRIQKTRKTQAPRGFLGFAGLPETSNWWVVRGSNLRLSA